MTLDHSPDNLDDLLDRFVAGECTRAEAEAVARWLEADPAPPARRERLERFRRVWAVSRRPGEDAAEAEAWDVEAAWRRAAARLSPAKVLTLTPREPERRRRAVWTRAAARWAAAVALVLGSAAAIRAIIAARPTTSASTAGDAFPSAGREYATARGERMVLTLVDGTRVTLGAASKLTLPHDYGARARLVMLEGDGYFDVVHDTARPFTVRAGRGIVRDVGTKFAVRSYAPDQPVTVAVTEGEASLAGVSLRPGDLGRLDTNGAVRIRRAADLQSYTSWIEGRLVFDDTPLSEAIPVLERWYDLQIAVSDSTLYRRRLFATLGNEPVSRVLDLIGLSLGVRVERRGRTVTFSK